MVNSDAWRVLGEANGTEVLLAVDFDVTGRPEARFCDLAANLDIGLGFWESVPGGFGPGSGMTGTRYLDRWLDGLGADRPPVRAVLGYCVGCVYAAELADRLARTQERPPLVLLFDPETPSPTTLLWQFHKVMELVRPAATEPEMAGALAAGDAAVAKGGELPALAAELCAIFRSTGEAAFSRAGLDATRRAEFFGVFDAFMTYLSAAGEFDALARWASAVAVSSTSPASGLNGIRAHLPEAGGDLVAKEIRLPLEHAPLLGSPQAAGVVSDLLAEAV